MLCGKEPNGGSWDDGGYDCDTTAEGGFIITGYTKSWPINDQNVYILKLDANGDTIWTRMFGGAGADCSRGIKVLPDSGFIIAGNTGSYGGFYQFYFLRLDKNGSLKWAKYYGTNNEEQAIGVGVGHGSGFVFIGFIRDFYITWADLIIIKTDENGNIIWQKQYGGSGLDYGWAIRRTADGGYIAVGKTNSYGSGGYDVYLLKLDANGDTMWTRTYGGGSDDNGAWVEQLEDGGYIIVGFTRSFGSGGSDVYLIRTDNSGDTIWTRTYDGTNDDNGSKVRICADQGFIIAGATRSYGSIRDAYLIRTDANGDTIWTTTFGGPSLDFARGLQIVNDGGYILAGRSFRSGVVDEVYAVRTEPDAKITEKILFDRNLKFNIAPNPFRNNLTLMYLVPRATSVNVDAYSVDGRLMKRLITQRKLVGAGSITLDTSALPSGIYFLCLSSDHCRIAIKAIKE